MSHTIRQMRELRSLDTSNQTYRTRKDAGIYGDLDDDAPSGAAFVWGVAVFVIVALLLLVVLR